jgi:hypothetical protein
MANEYKTIERASHGATYQNAEGTYTVYAIGTYPRSSVLAGQQRRRFLDIYNSLGEAKTAHPDAKEISGTTYREPSLSHLPED